MADENWQLVRKIFDDALGQKPEERRKFVRRACGKNKALLVDVESLLASLDSADSFMENPAIAAVAGLMLNEDRQFQKGQFLNHYEVIGQLGAGGMGEVYLAQDTKLHRRVALKILRENLLSDKQANRRLLREAQAAALLEHPNICAIYEISEADDCGFIVMQYVEGETLAELLAEERLSTEKSLDLAIQIADALAEAHARGIIHRDIKPANIIVNRKGQVKVLDFGLAKIVEADARAESEDGLHSSGSVMGTVPFMSPEQLCGKPLDAGTDIFSFGALFYEMLIGRQAFEGESNAERISAILNDHPEFRELPEILQPIVGKCLMKKSDERYQTAQELLSDLLDARKRGDFSTGEKGEKPKISPTARIKAKSSKENERPVLKSPRFYFWKSDEQNPTTESENFYRRQEQTAETRRTRFNPVFVFSLLLMVFLFAGIAFWAYWQFDKNNIPSRFDALRPVRLTEWRAAAGGFYTNYRISNNGKLIAYSSSQAGGNENIYVKQTAEGEEIAVTKDQWRNVNPIWSPDDQRIAYASIRDNQTGIYVCPALGGAPSALKIIGSGDIFPRHWSKDGSTIFYEYQGNLFRHDLPTLETAQITDFVAASGIERQFSISPDENRIAFRDETDGQSDLWIMPLKGGEKTRLTNEPGEKSCPRWHPDGKRILYNVQIDYRQQIGLAYTDGRASEQITRGDNQYEFFDISADGTKIFYFTLENRSDIAGVNVETGEEFEFAATKESENWANISPDGKLIVYQTNTSPQFARTRNSIVVKRTGEQSPFMRLKGYNPRWLPDSRRISFLIWSVIEKRYDLWIVNTNNGEEKQLATNGVSPPSFGIIPSNRGEIGSYCWSPDGNKLVYLDSKKQNVWTFSTESSENVNLTQNENANVRYFSPLLSRDGKRLVFVSREMFSQQTLWHLWLWEEGKVKTLFSTAGGLRLLGWAASGDEIIVETTDGVMKTTPLDVKLLRIARGGDNRLVSVFKNIYADSMTLSPDGKTVAFTARRNEKDDIWTAATGGGEPKKITANGSTRLYYSSAAWSPDGKTVFFDKQEQIDTISMFENFK